MESKNKVLKSFSHIRSRSIPIARKILNTYSAKALDDKEVAVHAYVEQMAPARWIFWRRLVAVVNSITYIKNSSCLDFGCGVGIMLPFLKLHFHQVYGVDLEAQFAKEYLKLWDSAYSENHDDIVIYHDLESTGLVAKSLDLILALDVLEHIHDLDAVLKPMAKLLKPGGSLIVTGPTENWIYKLGRWITGGHGTYHHCNIYNIRESMQKYFRVKTVKRILYPFTLFLVLKATKE